MKIFINQPVGMIWHYVEIFGFVDIQLYNSAVLLFKGGNFMLAI